jgi:shikimate kinase
MSRIYLIGFKGCGKTTLGKKIAPDLGFDFIDLDDLIEKKYGHSITELYASFGETAFRQAEHDTFKEIPLSRNIVIATGGGFPRWKDNMRLLLNSGITVYIEEESQTLFERNNNISHQRPVLKGMKGNKLLDHINILRAEYEDIYKQASIVYNRHLMSYNELLGNIKSRIIVGGKS